MADYHDREFGRKVRAHFWPDQMNNLRMDVLIRLFLLLACALLLWSPRLAVAATCGDLATYCSAYARIYASELSLGEYPDDASLRKLTDEGYSDDGAKALRMYHQAGTLLFRYGVADPDMAYTVCNETCRSDPDTTTLGARLELRLQQLKSEEQGPELR